MAPIIVSSNTGDATPHNFGSLKATVALPVGGASDPTMLNEAGMAINRVLLLMNTKLYECNRYMAARITTVASTASYDLPTQFYKEYEVHEMDAATGGHKVRELKYEEYASWHQTYPYSSYAVDPGTPAAYTMLNVHDSGQITFLPTPDGVYYYDVAYYRRFASLVNDADVLDAPQEVEYPLVMLARADMIFTHAPQNQMGAVFEAKGNDAWARFLGIQNRHPDRNPRFRLPMPAGRHPGSGDYYIRIA